MKPWQFALLGLALLAIAGCRSDPAVPILERELRLKEDEIYRLRAMVEESQDCGRACQDRSAAAPKSTEPDEPESSTFRRRSGPSASGGATPPLVELPSQPAKGMPDSLQRPAPGPMAPGELEVPEHLRGPSKPIGPNERESGSRIPKPPTDHSMSPEPAEVDGPALQKGIGAASAALRNAAPVSQSAPTVPFTPSGDSRHVASIAIDRTLTGGIGDGDSRGDQGLLVVVEPRDRAGRTVDAPAEVSVVVLDPALEGEASRVARWDFTAAETAAMFRRSGSRRSIHLTTAWPDDPPVHGKLHLFVRYVAADGRKLQADQPIEVALPGDKTAQWAPGAAPAATPQMATRSEDQKPRRPVWSPDRR